MVQKTCIVTLLSVLCIAVVISCQKGPDNFYPFHDASFHPDGFSVGLEMRFYIMPEGYLELIRNWDHNPSYRGILPDQSQKNVFNKTLKKIPQGLKNLMEKSIQSIYLVEGFVGGGMLEWIKTTEGEMEYVLILNPAVFAKNLEDWIQFRDSSPFIFSGGWEIKINTSKQYPGLLHTLIHEGAHLLDFKFHYTPYTEPSLGVQGHIEQTEFTKNNWIGYEVSRINVLGDSGYSGYGLKRKIPIESSLEIYKRLQKSPYPTVYACSNWAEDFAETFTWTYLLNNVKIPFVIRITCPDNSVFSTNLEDNLLWVQQSQVLKPVVALWSKTEL